VNVPRRYRIALRAYPRAYREARQDEIQATLAEADDARGGRPATREAAALLRHALELRVRGSALRLAGLLVLAAALAPSGLWSTHTAVFEGGTGRSLDGPDLIVRLALAAAAILALTRRPVLAAIAGLSFPLAFQLVQRLAWADASGTDDSVLIGPRLSLPLCLLMFVAAVAAGRLSEVARRRAVMALLATASAAALAQAIHRPDLPGAGYAEPWIADLGPAAALAAAGLLLAAASAPSRLHSILMRRRRI
jgi:hypothetical protein